MTAGQVADHVRAQHRQQLVDLHHALFSDCCERQAGAVPLRLEGPAVTDRTVVVTVLASIAADAPGDRQGPPGAAWQVTVSGHRRSLGGRAALPGLELEGWARAVLGPKWEALAYHQGMVPSFGGQLGATGFVLYLDAAGAATDAPPRAWAASCAASALRSSPAPGGLVAQVQRVVLARELLKTPDKPRPG